MKNILIFPSWYASKEAPTSGSFFREQAILMQKEFNVQVWVSEKIWISKRRFIYNQIKKPENRFHFTNLEIYPPHGKVIHFPFCAAKNDELNLKEEIEGYVHFLEKEKTNNGFYPDLIHAHCSLKGGVIAQGISKALNIPYIITEHLGPFLLHNYNDFWKKKIIESFENANKTFAVSEHLRQQILMHNIKCNPIVTGNLVDDDKFVIKTNQTEKNNKFKGLIVTYYPNFIKDMDTFFEAMLELKQEGRHIEFEFTIVGGGEKHGVFEQNYYETNINEMNLQSFVSLVPSANRSEIVSLIHENDFLISTSIAETFGVAICEAMLCGKPVLSTKNGGINDYGTNENCILIPIKNSKELVKGFYMLKKEYNNFNPDKIRNSIQEKFGKKIFFERIKRLYLNTIEEC